MEFQPYPFEKLATLLSGVMPKKDEILLTIGEPQFQTPMFIQQALKDSSHLLNKYPKTAGEDYLKEAQIGFVKRRFGVELKDGQLLPTFGTREVLFNFPQYFLFDKVEPKIAFVNPFYQIYEGASIASRAKVVHVPLESKNGFLPQIEEDKLRDCDLVILNSPSNPTASQMSIE